MAASQQILQEQPAAATSPLTVAAPVASASADTAILSNEQNEQQQRVTPKELADALAELEAERLARLYHEAQTVEITDTLLKELPVEADAGQVWRRVQARRQRTTATTVTAASTTRQTQRARGLVRWIIPSLLFLSLCGNVFLGVTAASLLPQNERSVAALPENTIAYANLSGIQALARGTKPGEVRVSSEYSGYEIGSRQWQIIKLNGRLFVRAMRQLSNVVPPGPGNVPGSYRDVVFSSNVSDIGGYLRNEQQVLLPISEFARTDLPLFGGMDNNISVEGVRVPSLTKELAAE